MERRELPTARAGRDGRGAGDARRDARRDEGGDRAAHPGEPPGGRRLARLAPRLALVAFLVASAWLLAEAQRIGEARFEFAVTRLAEPARLPIIHEFYTGGAVERGPDRVRVEWGPVRIAGRDTLDTFLCLGTFASGAKTFYLLEAGERLYVERAEFIEPLLVTYEFYRRHGTLPAELVYLLDDPDLDRDSLRELVARLAGPTGPGAPAGSEAAD